jgi:hypothetical protein
VLLIYPYQYPFLLYPLSSEKLLLKPNNFALFLFSAQTQLFGTTNSSESQLYPTTLYLYGVERLCGEGDAGFVEVHNPYVT